MHRTVLLLAAASFTTTVQVHAQAAGNASFARDIAPILQKKCVTCHGPEKQKGNFRLDSFEALLKPGASKQPAVVPGKPEASHLLQLLTTKDADDRMPQKDDPLPAAQIALVERWIREGAAYDSTDRRAPLAAIIPRVPHPAPPEVYKMPLPVLALAFSPDGQQLASSGYNEVNVWSVADGKLLRRIRGVAQRTHALAWGPDASGWLAVAGGDPGQLGEVVLLDMRKGEVARVMASLPDIVLDVKFSPDGSRLAIGGTDNSIRVLDVAGGREQLRIDQHADWVMSVAWNHDGTELASASRDRSARVFNAKTGELEHSYLGHNLAVSSVAFSADGKTVFTAGRDKKIHSWAAKDAKKIGEITGFDDDILRIVVAGGSVWSCGADKLVRQHAIEGASLVRAYGGHADWVYSLAVHPATKRAASGSHDGKVRVWNTEDGSLVTEFSASPGWTPTGQK